MAGVGGGADGLGDTALGISISLGVGGRGSGVREGIMTSFGVGGLGDGDRSGVGVGLMLKG